MSATATRMKITQAKEIAARFIERIRDCCDRIEIAGSIRRRAQTVGDIEIVAVPRIDRRPVIDLFGDTVNSTAFDTLGAELDSMAAHGVVTRRTRSDGKTVWGQKMKYLTFEGVNVDLFTPDAQRFGLILLIRTGPAAYSHQLVTEKGKALVVGHQPNGRPITRYGMLPSHLRVQEGWLTSKMTGIRIPTPEEMTFYEHTRLPYLEPWERR